MAVGLAERGHEVTVICHGASERVQKNCTAAIAAPPDYDAWRAMWRLGPWLRWRFWQLYLARVRITVPEVIICSKGICTSALVRRFPGVPLVYLPHSRIEPVEMEALLFDGPSWLQRRLACSISAVCERWSLLHATTTVRFTPGNVDELRRHYRLPEETPFVVTPAGIVGPSSITPHKPVRPLRLLSLGRLVESKNLAFLLDALAKIPDRAWTLDIVGDGPQRVTLEQQAMRLNLADRVRFHGHHNETERFYQQSDLFLFPSRLESFGLVILEAMSHGVPALAIRADGRRYLNANHEIIKSECDGLLAADEAGFIERLQHCIANPTKLAPLGQRARQTYLARHQWPVVLDRWEKLLQRLVPGHAANEVDLRSAPSRNALLVPLAMNTEA